MFFFTVAPDDSSSYVVSVYTGLKFDPHDKLEDLTNDDFVKRATERHDARIKYAGIGALWYGAVMDAIWKHVIGWDWKHNKGSPGLYGIPEAAMQATEEQTRKRLHAHCLVWIEGASKMLCNLQSSNKRKQAGSKLAIAEIFDRTTSAKLIDKDTLPNHIFQHNEPCVDFSADSRKKPDGVSAQQLRDMRHQVGKKVHKGVIARCDCCKHEYTLEHLVVTCLTYLNSTVSTHDFDVSCWSTDSCKCNVDENMLHITGKKKLEELLFILSTPACDRYPQVSEIITNVVRNLHGDTHSIQCFKKGLECRYRMPALPTIATIIEAIDTFEDWYDYLGNKSSYEVFDIVAKRSEYDVFQNQSCIAVSMSKLGSNSNSQLCMSGLKAMYMTKYPTKDTQKEDEGEYDHVLHYTKTRLADKRFENDCSEALSRAIGATLAHNSSNIISAWLAKHLINHRSRFRFSHDFRRVPHNSVQAEIIQGASQWRRVKSYNGELYIDSSALQYLHRPSSLETVSLTEFVLRYHVARKTKNNQTNMICYDADYETYQAGQFQGILHSRHKNEYIPEINVWAFRDACEFGGLILDETAEISVEMEEYAREVLTCFCPFRTNDDLLVNMSYVQKFRHWYLSLQGDPEKFSYIHRALTNIQQVKNSLRIKQQGDVLCDNTEIFFDSTVTSERSQRQPRYDKQKAQYNEETLDFIQQLLRREVDELHQHSFCNNTHLSLLQLQNKGTWKCGFNNIPSMDKQATYFPIYDDDNPFPSSCHDSASTTRSSTFPRLTRTNLVEVILQRTTRTHSTSRNTADNADSSEANVGNRIVLDIEANGTPESIYLWAKQVFKDENEKDDLEQQQAFEILAAKFVLNYFLEADNNYNNNDTLSGTARSEYVRCKRLLKEMVGRPADNDKGQLIMFLTGPGGSGKSAIVKQLLRYGELFCSNIKQPFTRRTILVTACSGVAATLIHGQTLHSATFLNWKLQNIDVDEKAKFQNSVKLMIVDEISMLGGADMSALSKRMNWLTDN